MAFLRSDNPTNDGSPVALAIDKATNSMLLQTDWGTNLEICDMINSEPNASIPSASKMLRKQLRSEDKNTVKFTLELIDTCVKNCGFPMHRAIASKVLMDDIVTLTTGKMGWEVKEHSLKLIQQWATEFSRQRDELPVFYETYASLKTRGLQFPTPKTDAPVFTPPSVPEPAAVAPPTSDEVPDWQQTGFEKLNQDMDVVLEKVRLCREMLHVSPGIEQDDALSEVVGFLEACQPRFTDLIEAGMMGKLNEDLLSRALLVNEEVFKVLEAEKSGEVMPRTQPTTSQLPGTGVSAESRQAAESLLSFEDEEDDGELMLARKKPPALEGIPPPPPTVDPQLIILSDPPPPTYEHTVAATSVQKTEALIDTSSSADSNPFSSPEQTTLDAFAVPTSSSVGAIPCPAVVDPPTVTSAKVEIEPEVNPFLPALSPEPAKEPLEAEPATLQVTSSNSATQSPATLDPFATLDLYQAPAAETILQTPNGSSDQEKTSLS